MIKADLSGIGEFVSREELGVDDGRRLFRELAGGRTGYPGTGWLNFPESHDKGLTSAILAAARQITAESAVLVVIGIGGSYLGARAALELLKSPHYNHLNKKTPDILFVGNNLSGEYLEQVIALIGGRDFSVNYISKSGSTIEPSIAFRIFRSLLTAKYGDAGARKRIYVTTDPEKGKLRQLCRREGYTSFDIPQDIGGRYSVLTAVGLLPSAVAGIDIDAMLAGAREMMLQAGEDALLYACARQALYRKGKKIEILASFEPSFRCMGEWWKQLFGESEGKNGTGIFPAYTDFTTDLHSLGQYIQSGERTLFETFVSLEKPRAMLRIPRDDTLDDGLDRLAGKEIRIVNEAALQATKSAHIDGGVPVIELRIPEATAYNFGALVQFFEISCAVSALISGVNPFDQPGVEAYKKNLYSILDLSGKAGAT